MTRFPPWLRAALPVLLLAAAPASDGGPDTYRVRIPVTPGSGSTVQRLPLSATAALAAQTRHLTDLRIFDARGRAMPIARAPAAEAAQRRDTLTAMPILGAADTLDVRRVSLRLDPQGRARVVPVDGDVASTGGRTIVLGALLDARALRGAARTLTLDADVPEAQPVTFRIEASHNLSTWRTLGEKIVYRPRRAGGDRVDATVALGSAAIADDYLKVTWSTASRPLSPVVVRGGTLVVQPSGATALTYAAATLPPQRDAHALLFAFPFATPIATLRIALRGSDVLVPVRVLGREDAEHAWTLLGSGTAARTAPADIALDGRAFRTLKVEADARTPGFTTPPALRLGFKARDLLFLAAGTAPYTLAVGNPAASDAYLAADSLLAQRDDRPVATATSVTADARVRLLDADDPLVDRRQMALWAILLLGTVLLALFAVILWRRNTDAKANPIDR